MQKTDVLNKTFTKRNTCTVRTCICKWSLHKHTMSWTMYCLCFTNTGNKYSSLNKAGMLVRTCLRSFLLSLHWSTTWRLLILVVWIIYLSDKNLAWDIWRPNYRPPKYDQCSYIFKERTGSGLQPRHEIQGASKILSFFLHMHSPNNIIHA